MLMPEKKKNYAGNEFPVPTLSKEEKTQSVPSTVKLLHQKVYKNDQWGSGGLQAWPETGSLRELTGTGRAWYYGQVQQQS
jgi:hypothetical protein